MRKATTIATASCSRPARPRKALGACAQSKRAATVSPKREKGKQRKENTLRAMISDFTGGMSVYQIATKWGLWVETVENVIRQALKLQGRTA